MGAFYQDGAKVQDLPGALLFGALSLGFRSGTTPGASNRHGFEGFMDNFVFFDKVRCHGDA